MHEDLVRLGKEIEAARREQGLSASEVAADAGISPAYMRTIERGLNPKTNKPSRPALDALLGISRALRRDPASWLELAGYDAKLAETRPMPAKGGVEAYLRSVQESAKLLNQRGQFMTTQAVAILARLATEFQMAANGTIRIGSTEEPGLTQLAVESCREHLRAVSYQDEGWWKGRSGELYLENHEVLSKKNVEMTRIFLAGDDAIPTLLPTLERHLELGINTYVLDPALVDDGLRRDFVIYDDTLLREANPVDVDDVDRKTALFTDDPSRIQFALIEFDNLRTTAMAEGGAAERVITRHRGRI